MEPYNSQAITDDQLKALRDELYAKYRLYNEEYFGGHLPYLPILLRNKCYVDGHEAWGRFDFKATYSKITRKIIDIQDRGSITILTKYVRPSDTNHYMQTLLHEMIHAYIFLVLKRYPKDPHGELFMQYANEISAREGVDIQSENDMVSQSEIQNTYQTEQPASQTANTNQGGENEYLVKIMLHGNNPPFKFWVVRCPKRSLLQLYSERIRKAFNKTTATVEAYVCHTPAFSKLPADVNNLYGFGADNVREMCDKLGKYCGVDPSEFFQYFGLS